MNDLCYCQYAFTRPECRVEEIGPGVDPRFCVELIREGPIAALTSHVGLDQFAPERLQGKTAEDLQWLGKIAARHNEIICQAADSAAVLPLRLGTLYRSRGSLQDVLLRCRSTVAEALERLGNRREWGVKLYLEKRRSKPTPDHSGPPPPHDLPATVGAASRRFTEAASRRFTEVVGPNTDSRSGETPLLPGRECSPSAQQQQAESVSSAASGTAYLTRKKAQLDGRRAERVAVYQTIQNVEQRLADKAEHCCRVRNLPSDLTGRSEEMVFNAAYLLPASAQAGWLETVQIASLEVQGKGLVLELSGPWPPYHFCPCLEL
jgi:hypothetical protein